MKRLTPRGQPPGVAEWLAAIGSEQRLALVLGLVAGEKTVRELARACGFDNFTASRYLNVLRRAGVVDYDKDGRGHRYRLVGGKVRNGRLELTHPAGASVVLPLV